MCDAGPRLAARSDGKRLSQPLDAGIVRFSAFAGRVASQAATVPTDDDELVADEMLLEPPQVRRLSIIARQAVDDLVGVTAHGAVRAIEQ
jgi:hypothetical protein